MTMPHGAILLGYGGSEHSKIALAWADDVARQLSRPLHVLVSALDEASAPSTSVSTMLATPGEALVREAEHAHLTVLGARTQGPLKSMVSGSVSRHVTRHAPGPVVMVREPRTRHTGRIVVGVDGSDHSGKALELALRHAGETDGQVLVLHVRSQADSATDAAVQEVIDQVVLD